MWFDKTFAIFFVFEWKLYKQVTSCILQEKEEADNRYKMEKQNQELDQNLIFMKAFTKIDSKSKTFSWKSKKMNNFIHFRARFIKRQMSDNVIRNKEKRFDDIVAASAHEFPVFSEAIDHELQKQIKEQQATMRGL